MKNYLETNAIFTDMNNQFSSTQMRFLFYMYQLSLLKVCVCVCG